MSTNNVIPSGASVHTSMVTNIKQAFENQISDSNSILCKVFLNKSFRTKIQIQLAIQDAFRDIWKQGGVIALEFGLLGNPDELLAERYNIENDLGELAKHVFTLIEPAIVIDEKKQLRVQFDPVAVDKIVGKLDREQKGINDMGYLEPGETNKTEQIAVDRMIGFLKQAPQRLRSEIRKSGYPTRVIYDQFSEGKVFKALESVVLTSAFGFMTYGWHGLAYNALDTITRDDRVVGLKGGMAENILSNPIAMNGLTWGAGLLAATLIGTGLVYGARKKREYLIKDAEQSHKDGQKRVVGNWRQRNVIFSIAIAFAVGGALMEGAGILAHEVQGIYTSQKAFEVKKAVSQALDLQDPNSPVGIPNILLQKVPGDIDMQSKAWYEAEANRPGMKGIGSAAEAKRYLMDGKIVLESPKFVDPKLRTIVEDTENKLLELSPKSHERNYTFKLKAEGHHLSYESRVNKLRDLAVGESGWYTGVHKKGGSAKTPDFLSAKDNLERALGEFEAEQKTINEKWKNITGLYQGYIDKASAASDAKYGTVTDFSAKFDSVEPIFTELKKKISEVPKLEGRNAIEYWDELNDLVGKEGGITKIQRTGIVSLIVLRSGIMELLAALFLFMGLSRVKNYYNRPENLLSVKHQNTIYNYYESLIEAIQNAFSNENWKGVFPEHDGITRDQAEYLARQLIVKEDPTMIKWLPLRKEGIQNFTQGVKKFGKNSVGLIGDILSGNTQTKEEAYLAKFNNVLVALSEKAAKDTSGLGIPLSAIHDIVQHVLPSDTEISSIKNVPKKFDTAISDIATNLDILASLSTQTIEHHAIENSKDLTRQITKLSTWMEDDMSTWYNQLSNILRSDNISDIDARVYESIMNQMDDLRKSINDNDHPNFQDIHKWNKEKNSISTDYNEIVNSIKSNNNNASYRSILTPSNTDNYESSNNGISDTEVDINTLDPMIQATKFNALHIVGNDSNSLDEKYNEAMKFFDRISVEVDSFITNAPKYIRNNNNLPALFETRCILPDNKECIVKGIQLNVDDQPNFTITIDSVEFLEFRDFNLFISTMKEYCDNLKKNAI